MTADLPHSNEIASCEEAAYDSLPFKDAALLLFFKSQSELIDFAQQVFYYIIIHNHKRDILIRC